MIVLFCVNNDWLLKDPFARFKMSKEEVIPEFLTKEEIQTISEKDIVLLRQNKTEDWLRSSEVRKLLKISPGTLQSFRINGKLKPSKIGGIHFYRYADIEKLLNENTEMLSYK